MATVITKGRYQIPAHINYLNKKLLDVVAGRTRRLIINLPPRHGKSELISKYFPAWFIGNYPDKRIILVSYEAMFAASWGRRAKEILDIYGKEIFNVKINRFSNSAFRWDIEGREGGLSATGIGGAITGKGANILIIDDPIKNAEQAHSLVYREKTFDWFRSTAYTRLEPDGAIIIMMTRWHYDDLTGRLINSNSIDEQWEVVSLPAIATDNDILGRAPGEPLWAERYNLKKLEIIKEQIGNYWFSSLYQQQPIASEYQIFKPEWWRFFSGEIPDGFTIQSWDTAFKSGEQNDFTVCTTWTAKNDNYYLIDIWRGKVTFPDLLRQVINQYERYKPSVILIEDKASGQSLIQMLRRETQLPIKAVQVDKDKTTRAHIVTPLFENGQVYINENLYLKETIINECAEFPYGQHDDIVDSITQSLEYLKNIKTNVSLTNFVTLQKQKTNYYVNF